jgi:uncharacterized membrane protein
VVAVLTGPEERALSGIEAMESARDPAFARRIVSRKGSAGMSATRTVLGPVLCLAAVPLTLVLLVASPWFGLVGVAVFAVGLALSVRPAATLAGRLVERVDRGRAG